MDNCSVHHIREVKQLLSQAGILVLFLPPYGPDLNPLQLCQVILEKARCFIAIWSPTANHLLKLLLSQ